MQSLFSLERSKGKFLTMKIFSKLFTGMAILFLLFFLFSSFVKAVSVPRYLGYSGTLNSAAGSPVTGSYNIVFKIYNVASGGTALWTETHSVDVSGGFFSVTLGDTTVLDLDFSERYWLGITVATDSEMTPRTPLSSVGYSFVSDVSYGAFTSSTAASTSTVSGGNMYYNTGDGNLYVYDAIAEDWVDMTSQGTSIVDGTATSTILTWDGSNWSENTNFLVDSSGMVTTGTWHGARIDISDYTNLAVRGSLLNLTGDTLAFNAGTLTNGRICTFVTGTGLVCDTDASTLGHDALTLGTANGLSLTGQQLSLGLASTSTTGALSSTDWNTFNNKFNLPSLTSGSILFSNGTTIAQDNSNFYWDDVNNRLGIGTVSPNYVLDAYGSQN